jgi:DNA-directed RNA polymerase specialized sigma24 family protein
MRRQIILEALFEGRERADVTRRLGINVNTNDNHCRTAFRSLRHLFSQDAEVFTHVDRSLWYDRIGALRND